MLNFFDCSRNKKLLLVNFSKSFARPVDCGGRSPRQARDDSAGEAATLDVAGKQVESRAVQLSWAAPSSHGKFSREGISQELGE